MSEPVIDTSRTLEIGYSRGKLALYALGAASFVAVGVWMIGQETPSSRHSLEATQFWGYVTVVFFAFMFLIAVGRLLTARGAVISLTPRGFRDQRVSSDIVPWKAIADIQTWKSYGQPIMVLALHPGEEEKLRLTRIARWTRGANARLGADGLSIAAHGTSINHDALVAAAVAYRARHGRA